MLPIDKQSYDEANVQMGGIEERSSTGKEPKLTPAYSLSDDKEQIIK
jgi:hypothetical protein